MTDTDPIQPRKALELYKQSRETEVSESTLQSHEYRLKPFVEWCEGEDSIQNMSDLGHR